MTSGIWFMPILNRLWQGRRALGITGKPREHIAQSALRCCPARRAAACSTGSHVLLDRLLSCPKNKTKTKQQNLKKTQNPRGS